MKIDGNKTYLLVLAAIVIGALQGLDMVEIPPIVMQLLPIFGLGTVRHGIKKQEALTKDLLEKAK